MLAVAAQNPNTIVVVHSVGPMILEPWIDHPNVTAVCTLIIVRHFSFDLTIALSQVLWAGLPGQESGNSLTDVLYGARNPSGRLPYTIAKQASDYPAQVVKGIVEIDYTEG